MTEEEIKVSFISPAITAKREKNKRMEYYFTNGRLILRGNIMRRGQGPKSE
jgi:hypothetical protein